MIRRPAPGRRGLWRGLGWAAAISVLLGVFAAYLRPDMAFGLAQQLWSCF